jgi:hypothetical protein
MDDDSRVREVLGRIADDAPGPATLWDTTQRRIGRRRHRRALLAGVAAVVVLALGGATVAAVTSGDGDEPSVAVEPEPRPEPELPTIVAVVNGRLVAMSPDGTVLRPIGNEDPAHPIVEVAGSPRGRWIAFTQSFPPTPGCSDTPKLNEVSAEPPHEFDTLVGASIRSPLASPDGSMVAYEMRECGQVGDVGITTLGADNENFRFAVPGERPLAWTLDSQRILVVQGEGEYRLANVPRGEERDNAELPAGAHAAAFISDSEVALAITSPLDGEEVAAYDVTTGAKRQLMTVENRVVTTLSFDPETKALLAVATSDDGTGALIVRRGNGQQASIIPGLTAATWASTPTEVDQSMMSSTTAPTASSTTTTAPTTTTIPIVTTGTLPPPDGFAGYTDWRRVDLSTLGETFLAGAASPQAKVDAMVAAFRAEAEFIEGRRDVLGFVTTVSGNRAQVEVRVIGFADDSVGGSDYRLYLLQEQDGEPWIVVAMEQRDLCLRGVAEGTSPTVCI